ncbi:hypothetical protein EJ110_NYTH09643 [Nymphaea thermarum]|nr:hypothetical protein EJ110_NYTH09643 [Nymphaea thermarum]
MAGGVWHLVEEGASGGEPPALAGGTDSQAGVSRDSSSEAWRVGLLVEEGATDRRPPALTGGTESRAGERHSRGDRSSEAWRAGHPVEEEACSGEMDVDLDFGSSPLNQQGENGRKKYEESSVGCGTENGKLERGSLQPAGRMEESSIGHRVEKGIIDGEFLELAGGMNPGGQMDLDNRGEFPDLRSAVGAAMRSKVGATMRSVAMSDNLQQGRVGAACGKAIMQQGQGDALGIPQGNGLKGWAGIVAGNQDADLENCPAATIDRTGDEPTVVFPFEAYQKMEEQYRFAAVAGFYGGKSNTGMDYRYVFQALRQLWININCPKFSVIGNGRFLVRVSSEEELREVLCKKWVVGGRFLITSRWKPGTELRLNEEESIPLWIRFPQLPILFWNSYSFKAIAQGMGASFIRADECTMHRDKLSFARVCIDVPLNFKPVPKITIEVRGKKISQDVLYESRVRYCSVCGTTSHYEVACKNKGSAVTADVEEQAWNKVLVIKKPKGGLQRSEPRGKETQGNRFASLGSQHRDEEKNDNQPALSLKNMATSSLRSGSSQQRNGGRGGDNEHNKVNTRVMKGGNDSASGGQEKGHKTNDEEGISNPFLSHKQIAVNRLGEQTSPMRFMFAARNEDPSSDKETLHNINMKEGSDQGLNIERKQIEATDIKQRGTRKSTRFASKGKKGRPPATVSSLEDVIVHRYNGTKKRKKEIDNMNHALIELPHEEDEGENVSGKVIGMESDTVEAPTTSTHENI